MTMTAAVSCNVRHALLRGAMSRALPACLTCVAMAFALSRVPDLSTVAVGQGLFIVGPLSGLTLLIGRRAAHRHVATDFMAVVLVAATSMLAAACWFAPSSYRANWAPGAGHVEVLVALFASTFATTLTSLLVSRGLKAWARWRRRDVARELIYVVMRGLVCTLVVLAAWSTVRHTLSPAVAEFTAHPNASGRAALFIINGLAPVGAMHAVFAAMLFTLVAPPLAWFAWWVGERVSLPQTLLARAAHDLRHTLATVRCHVDDARGAAPSGELRASLVASLAELSRARGLLNDVSEISVGRAGVALQTETVDVAMRLEDLLGRWRRPAWRRARQALVVGEIDDGLVARCDPARLDQILVNVVWNAVVHTPPGGVIVVQARRDASADEVEIVVRDTGPGIPAGQHAAAFGRGHGLAQARSLAQSMRGQLELHESAPGLAVAVRLPA